jgi:hypothetical protein
MDDDTTDQGEPELAYWAYSLRLALAHTLFIAAWLAAAELFLWRLGAFWRAAAGLSAAVVYGAWWIRAVRRHGT